MKNVTKIVILTMYAALSLSSCRKVHITPEETKTPLGFTAVSQTGMTKDGTEVFPYSDFGVWGVARHSDLDRTYMLWDEDDLAAVYKNHLTGYFEPTSDAYWMYGYTYNFIAIAPWVSDIQGTTLLPQTDTSGDELMFSYNMSSNYNIGRYDFDLLGAVAQTEVTSGGWQDAQELIFWHLFSKIRVNISFTGALDAAGNPAAVKVDVLRLKNVDVHRNYTLSFDSDNELSVECVSASDATAPIQFAYDASIDAGKADFTRQAHIVPQNVSDVVMELDFTVGEGANAIPTTNYQIDMGAVHTQAGVSPEYIYNGVYNWTITINPKTISFNVTVTPWQNATGLPDFDIK